MREFVGWVIVHAVLIVVGLVALRALGLGGPGWRSGIAALGPALLLGVCLVVLSLIVLLVCGLPATVWTAALVSAAWAVAGGLIVIRRARSGATLEPGGPEAEVQAPGAETEPQTTAPTASIRRLAIALLTAYAAFGAYALARVPTVSDDARIWSLKGLTLTYYDTLRPEMFASPLVARAHPVYPLLQPVFEAILFRGMGHPALRWFHSELWLLCGAALWTAAYLLSRTRLASHAWFAWAPALALLAVAPQVLLNIGIGYADTFGSIVLASGIVALGLWFERGGGGCLGVAAVLLAGAANIKDEDFIATGVVVVVAALALAVRRRRGRGPELAAAVAFIAAAVLPWRIWVSAHHLSDSVSPPIPRALNPAYVLDRLPELKLSATAMVSQVLSGYGWLAAIFLGVCIVCLVTGTARRTTAFYLGTFLVIVAALLWLYTTTPLSLGFLIPTSMDRTVSVFMAMSAFASAHLLATLVAEHRQPRSSGRGADLGPA